MSTPHTDTPPQVPDDWTPQEALTVYEYLTAMSEAVWERYACVLQPLLHPDPDAADEPQADLFDPDDSLPF